jgi:hypothetical protein
MAARAFEVTDGLAGDTALHALKVRNKINNKTTTASNSKNNNKEITNHTKYFQASAAACPASAEPDACADATLHMLQAHNKINNKTTTASNSKNNNKEITNHTKHIQAAARLEGESSR